MTTATADAGGRSWLGPWRGVVQVGLLGALVALYICLVGIVPVFDKRPLIKGVISLGQAALAMTALGTGYMAAVRAPTGKLNAVLGGAMAGLMSGAALSLLILLTANVDLRKYLPNASPALIDTLTLKAGVPSFWVPAVVACALGAGAAAVTLLPRSLRRTLLVALAAVVTLGLFAGLLRTPMLSGPLSGLARQLFASDGLTPVGALITVLFAVGVYEFYRRVRLDRRYAQVPVERRKFAVIPMIVIVVALVLVLPFSLGPFFAQVVALIALYVLMGLGLNITLGLAGLLDLGFVAFFAVGAYTVGLLTSTAEYGIAHWPFWAAIPFAVFISMGFGILLGLPILGIRGDYLAIATLGFGEIVRILAGSDLMKPLLGGPRGIIDIPKPINVPPDSFLAGPNQIYYIALACAVVIAFVAWRLASSRLGRAWVAIREDEDVAEALGINLVQTKQLAYMLGAAFAGLGGAVFAALIGSIFSSSIQLYVSINVVALIIVGGMGSIPGVILGAIVLIGLPELFRELSEFRFLFYGVALIVMMRYRPEGIVPSRTVKRELRESVAPELPFDPVAGDAVGQAAG